MVKLWYYFSLAKTVGTSCESKDVCGQGLVCDHTSTCVHAKNIGEECYSADVCKLGLVCDADNLCGPGMLCVTTSLPQYHTHGSRGYLLTTTWIS